ncbi:cysteine proteinase [Daedalea quercina L-15889]|uniref:Cysteine proteinase n=1 Tax=Daedalea quercina L-15889 TaxID=1314783 RepID=A0A165PUN9_9APHY|nr:cysteine proteinase [Daedalea quercina L-15889]
MGLKAHPVPRHRPVRSRTTRSRGKPLNLSDPAENSQLLNEQLRAMGLYAAPTLGDGNCLFRALSDQLYGTPAYHLKLRQDICDWIAAHKQRYAPFVDDERGLDVHLQCMRQPATYGGHLELSAFAHMMRRDVKVIQPGLVYVIEWATGGDVDEDEDNAASTSSAPAALEPTGTEREKRRAARERKRAEKERERLPPLPEPSEEDDPPGPVYVAYHDWEHFSSIRNLRGPHTGIPEIVEAPAPDASAPPSPAPAKKKPLSKAKVKPESRAKPEPKGKPESKPKGRVAALAQAEVSEPQTPSQIPLPASRSVSPLPSRASPVPSSVPTLLSDSNDALSYRSPKRTFDESSASSQGHSESSQSASKRQKSSSRPSSRTARDSQRSAVGSAPHGMGMLVDDADIDTPDLSASGSSSASESSLSSVPSPEPSPPPALPPSPIQPRLTRRQRKALGLPKPRAALVANATAKRSGVGRIVVPGGKSKKFVAKPAVQDTGEGEDEDDADANAEWRKNGTGRVDVRGFRELKI